MASAPCGCDLAEDAAKIRDDRGRAVVEGDAAQWQKRWHCPFAGYDGTPPDDLTPTLAHVERVLGCAGEITRCPGSYARTEDAAKIAGLYSWWLKGQLAMRCPAPSGAVVDAIDAMHSAVEAAKADGLRRIREEHERKR